MPLGKRSHREPSGRDLLRVLVWLALLMLTLVVASLALAVITGSTGYWVLAGFAFLVGGGASNRAMKQRRSLGRGNPNDIGRAEFAGLACLAVSVVLLVGVLGSIQSATGTHHGGIAAIAVLTALFMALAAGGLWLLRRRHRL